MLSKLRISAPLICLFMISCSGFARINRGPVDHVFLGGHFAANLNYGSFRSRLPEVTLKGVTTYSKDWSSFVYAGGTGRFLRSELLSFGLGIFSAGSSECSGKVHHTNYTDAPPVGYALKASRSFGAGAFIGVVQNSCDVVRFLFGFERRPFKVSTVLGTFKNSTTVYAWGGRVAAFLRHPLTKLKFPIVLTLGYMYGFLFKNYELLKGQIDISTGLPTPLPLGGVKTTQATHGVFLGLEYVF